MIQTGNSHRTRIEANLDEFVVVVVDDDDDDDDDDITCFTFSSTCSISSSTSSSFSSLFSARNRRNEFAFSRS